MRRIGRRGMPQAIVIAAAINVVVGVLVVLWDNGDVASVDAQERDRTSVVSTSAPDASTIATEPPATSPPTTSTTAATTTGSVCLNSHDSACGSFQWSPEPAPNSASVIDITAAPASPRVGDTVTFHVVARDAESMVTAGSPCYGDTGCLAIGATRASGDLGYGSWSPPPLQPSVDAAEFTHTYQVAGTFTFQVRYVAAGYPVGSDCPGDASSSVGQARYTCLDPYFESGYASITITIEP